MRHLNIWFGISLRSERGEYSLRDMLMVILFLISLPIRKLF